MVDEQQPHTREEPEPGLRDQTDKLNRVADHTRGLVEDLTSWLDLKLEYTMLNIRDQFIRSSMPLAHNLIAGIIASIALLFGLIAAALGLGEWLSHPAWGFLLVAGVLALAAWIVHEVGKRRTKSDKPSVPSYSKAAEQKKLSGPKAPEQQVDDHGKDQQ